MLLINAGLIYWGIFISLIGMALFMYGKKKPDGPAMIIGIILAVYPYFISSLAWSIVVGVLVFAVYAFLKIVVRL